MSLPTLKAGERRPCEACGTDLIGARTKAGKVAPIVFAAQANGNVLLYKSSVGIECRTFAGETLDVLRAEQIPLRLNHFASCPERERFERK